jgi:23S rRNA pseudouridine2605 synthase
VKVHGRVTPEKLLKMTKPITMNGKQYGPLRVTVDRALTTNVWLNVEMKKGKNREIRRIMQKCDLQVNKLVRLEYGKYKLKKVLKII